MENYEIVKFVDNDFELDVRTDKENETVWLRAEDMASLFNVNRPAIVKHINNILNDGELDVTYTNGEKYVVNMSDTNVIVEGYDNTKLGKQTITLKYMDLTAFVEILFIALGVNTMIDMPGGQARTFCEPDSTPYPTHPQPAFFIFFSNSNVISSLTTACPAQDIFISFSIIKSQNSSRFFKIPFNSNPLK